MGLDDRPGDTDEGGTAHLIGVQLGLEGVEPRHDAQGRQLGQQVLLEHGFQGASGERAYALHGFQQHIAGEAVADDDVAPALDGLLGLNVADEVQVSRRVGLPQPAQGLLLEIGALAVLGADVQQSHTGPLYPKHPVGVVAAQIGELYQIFRGTLGVGAAVDEYRLTGGGGNYRGHGRPTDAPDALDDEGSAGEQSAGAAGGDHGVGPAVPQHGQSHAHGGVLLPAEHRGGVVAHLHRLSGVDDLHALGQRLFAAGLQRLQNSGGVAGEGDVHAPALLTG